MTQQILPALDVARERTDSRVRLTLSGQILADTRTRLRHEIEQLPVDSITDVQIDMEQVDLIDSSGVGMLVFCHRHLRKQGIAVRFTNLKPEIERTLQVCHLFDLLNPQPGSRLVDEEQRQHLDLFSYVQQMMNCMGDGLMGMGPDRRILFVDEVAEKILGKREIDLLGRHYQDCFTCVDEGGQTISWQAYRAAAAEKARNSTFHGEVRIKVDDRVVPLQVTVTDIIDHGVSLGLLIGLRDLSDKEWVRLARAKTAHLETVATLAGGLAHDLNNLMFVVLGAVDLLKTTPQGSDEYHQTLKRIESAGERASALSDRLLAFSGSGNNYLKQLDMNVLARRVLLSSKIPETIEFETKLNPNLRPVNADERQMEQLIRALVDNAMESMEDYGPVRVVSDNVEIQETDNKYNLLPGSYVQLEVTDTGAGMSDEVLARAFDPFFTTKMIGRGMGLPAAYGIVTSHMGAIAIDTVHGRGTTVRILLPSAPGIC